jgi:Ca2+-binding RTX toxin-like protein
MNRIKQTFVAVVTTVLLLGNTVLPALAVEPIDVTGNYTIGFECVPACGGPYVHDAFLTQTGSSVTGNGGFPAGGPYTFTWHITSGTVTGNTINLTVVYDTGALGTVMHMTGTVATDGKMSGLWDDDFGGARNGTWSTSTGTATVNVPAECDQATSYNVINGTEGSDNITGTNGADLIFALGGADRVDGRGGDDCIIGGEGSNRLLGGNDDDTVIGGDDFDSLEGGAGADVLYGMGSSDSLKGGNGADDLFGGEGSDSLHGENGQDVLHGEEGSDSLKGGDDADDLFGEEGSDSLRGEGGNDHLFGGEGSDSLKGDAGSDTAEGGADLDSCNAEVEAACEA